MICKDDLVTWFKKLESYKRIDVMCTLLNLCLPFELRFLGTCLEELGRRDAQDLRGVELRVNNSQEFVSEIMSFQQGQPTDMKLRRKMALYLALMRACNRTGVNELFRTLDRWGDRDFTKFSDGDPLQELLLVFTMATNHPVFSFEQRIKCGEIYSKIISSKAHLNQQQSSSTSSPITSPLSSASSFTVQQQLHQPASPPPFQSATFQAQPAPPPQLINPAATPQQLPNPMLMPMTFPQAALIQSADPNSIALSVDSLSSHLVPAPPSMNMVQIPADFSTPPPWQTMRYQPQIYSTMVPLETQSHYPPQPTSPHLSQPSSPTHSRTGSPSRQQQQQPPPPQSQQQANQNPPPPTSHRNSRIGRNRPSAETTPPPLQQQQSSNAQTQGSGTINFMGNNDIMVQTIKNFDELNVDGAISQLHSIRNGYNRPSNAIQRQNHKTNWTTLQWQMQQQQQQQAHGGLNYTTMHMDQIQQMQLPHKSSTTTTGSESGSGSSGDITPPPSSQNSSDPGALHGNINQSQSSGIRNKQALNLNRLNGGGGISGSNSGGGGGGSSNQNQMHQSNSSNSIEFNGTSQTNPNSVVGASTLVSSNSSGNLIHIAGGPIHNYPASYHRNLPASSAIQRQFPAPMNGEISVFPFSPGTAFIAAPAQVVAPPPPSQQPQSVVAQQPRVSPSQTPPVILPTPYPTNKLVQSCFNCGSINHTGLNCSEASMEDVTRNAIYKLDYSAIAHQQLQQSSSTPQFSVMTTSLSSSSLSNQASSGGGASQSATVTGSNNNISNETEPSITFIDLTQDTSSDSSISNR